MAGNFLITNQLISKQADDLKLQNISFGYYIYTSSQCITFNSNEISIIINGYVHPRNHCFSDYKKLNQYRLIATLIEKYKDNFINYIKGNFTIIIIRTNSINVFTDHFGLQSCFLYKNESFLAIANSINQFCNLSFKLEFNINNIAFNSLLYRIPANLTLYKSIFKIRAGMQIIIKPGSFNEIQYWSYETLLKPNKAGSCNLTFFDFADLIKLNFKNFIDFHKPSHNAITLTGGKDSRTGLAALRANGITTLGFTYGNPLSRDALYAQNLANLLSIPHTIYNPPDKPEYFDSISNEILRFGNPEISLHRSHRLFAFRELASILSGRSAYYAGYMAGELLMGIYYDDLVFSNYLTNYWDTNELGSLNSRFDYFFHKSGTIDTNVISERISRIKSFDPNTSTKERQFHSIFEIGIQHHCQDIFLASQFFDFVYPFFLDIELLEALFDSQFNFFYSNNKSLNLFSRYKLFEFNLNIQHILYPLMDEIPFAKRGSYNTKEYLKGKFYWSLVKSVRYLFQRHKYPVTYEYGPIFREYLIKQLLELNSDKNHILNQYFDISAALTNLRSIKGNTNEASMHRFSNLVTLYKQSKLYIN